MKSIIKSLVIDKRMMDLNLSKTNGLFNAQRIMIKLIQKDISRERDYKIVQKIALESWKQNKNMKDIRKNNKEDKAYINIKE